MKGRVEVPTWLFVVLVFMALLAVVLLYARCVGSDSDADPPYPRWGSVGWVIQTC